MNFDVEIRNRLAYRWGLHAVPASILTVLVQKPLVIQHEVLRDICADVTGNEWSFDAHINAIARIRAATAGKLLIKSHKHIGYSAHSLISGRTALQVAMDDETGRE
jgi:hypothetical protein